MSTIKLIIRARIYEVPILGQFSIDSYSRDDDDFITFKPNKYTPAFLTALLAKQTAVNDIVNPVVLTAELKQITIRLHGNMIGLRNPMNWLQGYVNDATGLTVPAKDFGISQVRKSVNKGDAESLDGNLKTLLINIDNNMTKLSDVGYTDAMRNALKDAKAEIFKDNAQQNKKIDERGLLVAENLGTINDFLKDIKAIWTDGKLLYKITDKVRVKDYTNSELLKRIRHDELHTIITGSVYNKEGKIEPGAKIVARPSTEGKRGKTVTSDPKGHYELKGLRPINYILTVTLKSGAVFMTNVDAKTNETVKLDLREGM
jgi:hypothetical protein